MLFSAFFEQGLDLGNVEVLIRLAEQIGIERHMAHAHLSGDSDLNAVYTENARMHRLGITGVPCFIFNEGRAIAGAQEPEILIRMIDMAVAQDAERPAMQSSG